MSDKTKEHEYRIKELERQLKGLQRQVGVINAVGNARNKSTDQRLRDLEIKTAVVQGAPQKEIAKIYNLSPGRVSQIVKKIA
ncbi:RNA polymerase sigma-70 region 4 domain-containing protein (plasmid) [Pararobbsia alpina]|uniref:sigma factor-like helix-turn-helix DNA-binding protein n=1 Tax=Pararobbsia alpina TaxID=621374 RepID=UPI0039A77073